MQIHEIGEVNIVGIVRHLDTIMKYFGANVGKHGQIPAPQEADNLIRRIRDHGTKEQTDALKAILEQYDGNSWQAQELKELHYRGPQTSLVEIYFPSEAPKA